MSAGTKRLVLAWAIMAALTLAAIVVGHAQSRAPLGAILTGALLAMAFVKSAILLGEYLELRHAPTWNRALRGALFALLAALFGLSLLAA